MESRIPCIWLWNSAQGIRNPTNDWNLNSEFHWRRIQSPVPGIQNPQFGIKNPRLCLIGFTGAKGWSNLQGYNLNAEGNLWENTDFCSSKDLELRLVQQCSAVLNASAHILLLQYHSNVSWHSLTSWCLRLNSWFSKCLRTEYCVKVLHHIWLKLYVHLKHILSI